MDRSELEQLYRDYGPTVVRRARAILGTEAEAHDALQEVFVILLEKGATFREESAVLTWVYRITTNVCLGRLRRSKRHHELLQERGNELLSNASTTARPDSMAMLRQLLCEAQADEAHAALCHFVDGLTHSETASVMECSRRKVCYLVERFTARARERWNLAPQGEDHA